GDRHRGGGADGEDGDRDDDAQAAPPAGRLLGRVPGGRTRFDHVVVVGVVCDLLVLAGPALVVGVVVLVRLRFDHDVVLDDRARAADAWRVALNSRRSGSRSAASPDAYTAARNRASASAAASGASAGEHTSRLYARTAAPRRSTSAASAAGSPARTPSGVTAP